MKTNILLLIATIIIFSGCGKDDEELLGACVYKPIGYMTKTTCQLTYGEKGCKEKAFPASYVFTPEEICK